MILPDEGWLIEGLLVHRSAGPCYLLDFKEPQLGCATTEQLMQELIARFEGNHASGEEFRDSVNYLRAQTLWNILFGMDSETKEYRTIDN